MRLLFVVESGTDVRLVEDLATRFDLRIIARAIPEGRAISHSPTVAAQVLPGPAARLSFAAFVLGHLLNRNHRYDHLLVQGYALAALAANVAGRMRGIRVTMLVCSPVESYYRCRPHPRALALRALGILARWNARLGARYVVLSRYLAQVVRSHGARGRVDIVPVYGVDTETFHPLRGNRAELRARLGLPERGALLLFSSRIAPEKDVAGLLLALKELLSRGRDVWLVNRSGNYAELVNRAREHGIAERVLAADAVHPVRELPDLVRACDVCVQASLDEGLGFSVLEAMAAEIPVVASQVGGLRETVIEGETGWPVPARDPAALAAAIERVLDRPEEARRRALRARQMVLENYTRERSMARLEQLLAGRLSAAEQNQRGAGR